MKSKLQIVYDDEKPSQLLYLELTRDWTKPNPKIAANLSESAKATLAKFQLKRDAISKRVILVHKDKSERGRDLEEYPAYRFGDYSKFEPFDRRAFAESSYPLLTVEAILHNVNVDVKQWKEDCLDIEEQAEIDYSNQIMTWAAKHHSVQSIAFSYTYYQTERHIMVPPRDRLVKEFGKFPDMPKFQKPAFPPCPELPFPWEGPNPYRPTLLPGEH